MRNVLLFSLILICSSAYSQEQTLPEAIQQDPIKKKPEKEKIRIFRFSRLTLQENPNRASSSIPRDFVPPNSELLFSTELKSERYFENREAVLILKSVYSKKIVETYYEALISQLGHKILQSQKTDSKSLYLVEVFNRKTIAISVLPGETGAVVKLFHRTSGGF